MIVASPKSLSLFRLSGISGKASTSDSRFVTSFLDVRLRFRDVGFAFDFSILEIKVERLIMRLSLFVEPKALAISRRLSEGLVMLLVGLDSMEARFRIVGACNIQPLNHEDSLRNRRPYHLFWFDTGQDTMNNFTAVLSDVVLHKSDVEG